MIKCDNWPISVCTWSLENDFDKIDILREQTQISHINLAVLPSLEEMAKTNDESRYLQRVQDQGWNISATMINFPHEDYSTLDTIEATGGIIPDDSWVDSRKRIIGAMDITHQLGVKYLLFHFGFLDYTDSERVSKLRDRAKLLADAAGERQIMVLMETGQETAADLQRFL